MSIFQRVVVGDGWRGQPLSRLVRAQVQEEPRGGLLLQLLHWGQDVEQGRGRIVRIMLVTVCRQATAAGPRVVTLLPPGQGRGPGRHQAEEVASEEEPGQVEPALLRPRAALNRAEVSYGSKKGKREGP